MVQNDLKHLYEWTMVDRVVTDDEGYFIKYELYFTQFGIRTKVLRSEDNKSYEFWVPSKDFQVVNDYYKGEVSAIHTSQKEFFNVFHEDLTFKNKNLYENKYAVSQRYTKIRNFTMLAIVIIVIWILVRWRIF